MKRSPAVIRASVAKVREAEQKTLMSYRERRIENEVSFTNRFLTNIENSLDGFETKGLRWTVKVFTDHGSRAQEPRFGADFIGFLSIDLEDYKVEKGFLGQAKLIKPGRQVDDKKRLKEQCGKMLAHSYASYVFIYQENKVTVAPARAVVSSTSFDVNDEYTQGVTTFFKEHIQCFIGDPNLVPAVSDDTSIPYGLRIINHLDELGKSVEGGEISRILGVQTVMAAALTRISTSEG